VTYEALPGCQGPKGEGCEMFLDLVTPLYAIGWAVVASLLVYLVSKLLGRAGAGPVVGLGCGFWILLWIVILTLGLGGGGAGLILVPIIAYGLAWAVVRPRSPAHGDVTRDPP
jgi:hypothetical protein